MAGTHVFDLPHRSTLFRVSSHFIAFNGSDCNLMVLSSYLRDQMDQRDFVQQALTFHGSINSNQIHLLISSFPKKDLRHCQIFTPASWLLKASAALFFPFFPSFLSTLALFNSFSHNLTCLASSFFLLSSSSALSFLINSFSFSILALIAASLCSESILQFWHFCFEVSGSMGRIQEWMEPVRQ